KTLADKKKEIFDEDLLSIVEDGIISIPETYRLEDLNITSGNKITPSAVIGLKKGSKILKKTSTGDGPVDACYNAIDAITGLKCKLLNYSLKSITGGKDALGEVTVRIRSKNEEVSGRGTSTDIIEASTKAYVNAVNKLIFKSKI
ncbi:MAG: alpha-isopropylmalate synthase regulatory domain-containing protein, partial [Candidatus Omnitrophota bacterium]|nr:alpha-isopropylmalate synthase regulatory domain-containing protein [Candidatus Omnitrophota bacterium]